MKKILLSLSVVFIAAMMLVSCSSSSPKDVAKTWLTSFYHMEYEAAKKVSTDDTKNFITQLQTLSSMMPDSAKKEMQKMTVNIKDEKVEGDNATVTYNIVSGKTQDAPKDETLKLVKKDGKWLVQFSKNDAGNEAAAEEPAEEPAEADSTGAATEGAATDTAKHE